jgi:hypothetical protein
MTSDTMGLDPTDGGELRTPEAQEEVPERTLEDVIAAAARATEQGVPVDWKAICIQTFNILTEKINKLVAEKNQKEIAS